MARVFGMWHPRAVVFDCDGLLMDTESLWVDVQRAVCERLGVGFSEELQHSWVGMPGRQVGPLIAARAGVPSEGVVRDMLELNVALIAEAAGPLPGAQKLVAQVVGKVPGAVASNSGRRVLDAALAKGAFEGFEVILSVEDVERPKPAPDLYLAAAEILGEDPGDCLAFEDSERGAEAARAAGYKVIGVPNVPGQQPVCDVVLESLDSPELLDWVASWP